MSNRKTKPYKSLSCIKTPGGKKYLRTKLWAMAPKHRTYLEPFAGGLEMLLGRNPEDPRFFLSSKLDDQGVSEIVCEAGPELSNFWQVMRDQALFPSFQRATQATGVNEKLWAALRPPVKEETLIELSGTKSLKSARAWAMYVRCRMSMMGLGKTFCPLTTARLRRSVQELASSWVNSVDQLDLVHMRLYPVCVIAGDGIEASQKFNDPAVFQYLDPPYPHVARSSEQMYEEEMTIEQHEMLLKFLTSSGCQARVMLSTYANELYSSYLDNKRNWRCIKIDVHHSMHKVERGGKKAKKQELVYVNYPESEEVGD